MSEPTSVDPIRARLVSSDTGEFTCDVVWDLTAALRAVLDLLDDPGGPDTWSHTHEGRHALYADDIRRVIAEHLGVTDVG